MLSFCLGGAAKFFRKKAVDANSRENVRVIGRRVYELNSSVGVNGSSESGLISRRAASSICSTMDSTGGSYGGETVFGPRTSLRISWVESS